jgi:putative ABC transport system permease protein
MAHLFRIAQEACASLRMNPGRTFLMALGISVGIGALTAVVAIGQGTSARIMGLVAKHGLDMLMVRPGTSTQAFAPGQDRATSSLSDGDAAAIESSVANVRLIATVQNQRGWDVKYGDTSVKTRLFGVSHHWEAIRRRGLLKGEGISEQDNIHADKVVVLGYTIWQELFGDADPVGRTVILGKDAFRVKGVYVGMGTSATGEDWDDRVVVPVTTTAKKLFGRTHLEQIILQLRDEGALKKTAEEIRTLLRERHQVRAGAEDDFFVREPADLEEAAWGTRRTLSRLLLAISGVAIVVGGVVIMNLMLVSVAARGPEIGIRRAVGARMSDILLQFFLEALGVTLLGGVLGAALGAAAAPLLSRDAMINWIPFAVALGSCGLVALTFGLYPARRAAAVDPIRTLRELKA